MKLVSACLAGVKCRYDGTANPHPAILEMVQKGEALLICPEQLGGLSTPRPASERQGDRVCQKDGTEVTEEFRKGCEECVRIARLARVTEAILKSRSPSCGKGKIYDGTFSGKLIEGNGILTDWFESMGIKVITEEDL